MIAAYLEPKGLHPDTPSLSDKGGDARRAKKAVLGSAKLRDAILLAKGISPTFSPNVRLAAHKAEMCELCGSPAKPKMMVSHIQKTVCAYYGINPSYMISAQRGKDIARPRQIAMYLSRELTPKSLPDIGRWFNRDHTTVMHAIKAVEHRMFTDVEVLIDVEVLRERLGG